MKTPLPVALVLGVFLSVPGPLRADHPSAGDQLGTIRFAVSGTPAAREHVVRGVKLVHHMMYPEADREFAAAIAADPACALAYWGRAMALIHPLWPDAPTAADRRLGAGQIKLGLACPPATPRERAYLETLGGYYVEGAPADHVAGLKALDAGWAALAAQQPDDLDAAAFAALYHLAPARFLPKDKSHRLQLEAGRLPEALAAFEAVLASSPNRFNTLYGAGFAAERAGDTARARTHYEQLLQVASAGDASIARVEHARAFLARTPPARSE